MTGSSIALVIEATTLQEAHRKIQKACIEPDEVSKFLLAEKIGPGAIVMPEFSASSYSFTESTCSAIPPTIHSRRTVA
jgi:hypothetical protein